MVTNSKTISLAALLLLVSSCEDGGVSGLEDSGPCDPCTIFVTATKYNGNLGGISGADAKCASDANNPKDGTYKALIGGTTRRGTAGNQLDWVIKPSTAYQRRDKTLIAYSSSSGLLPGNLVNRITTEDSYNVLTGLDINGSVLAGTCDDWTNAAGSGARIGLSFQTDAAWMDYGSVNCSSILRNIYCVQQ